MAHQYEKDDIHHLENDAPMHGGAPIQRAISYTLSGFMPDLPSLFIAISI